MTQESGPAFACGNPQPGRPGRVVTDMLRVPAFQFGNPLALFILPKADDPALHTNYWITVQADGNPALREISRAASVSSAISFRGACQMAADGLPFSEIAAGTAPVKSKMGALMARKPRECSSSATA
jgi:hypothetical protein